MNTFYKVLLSIFAVAVLGIGGVYVYKTVIEKPSEDVIEVESVILSQNNITLKVGENIVLSAIVNPDNASDKTVNWTSSNPAVATVSNGVVQALSEGTTAVMATTTNNQMAICNVVVTKEVTETPDDGKVEVSSVTLNKSNLDLKVGNYEVLTVNVSPSNASNKTVTWESQNKAVAIVNNGVVEAVGEGTTLIVVTSSNGKVASCSVTVTKEQVDNPSDDNPNKEKLTAPVISGFDGTTIKWNAVPYADMYQLDVNGKVTSTEDLSCTFYYNTNTILTIRIKTIADKSDDEHADSEWSDYSEFEYIASLDLGLIGNYDGLGQSVNMVKAQSYSDYIKGTTVLDIAKLAKLSEINFNTVLKNEDHMSSSSSNSITDFMSKTDVMFNFEIGAQASYWGMAGAIERGLTLNNSFEYSDYASKYFYNYNHNHIDKVVSIANYKNTLKNMLDNKFLTELKNLSDDYQSYVNFFNKYGTHIIGAAKYGARLELFYSLVTNKKYINDSLKIQVEQIIKTHIEDVGSSESNMETEIMESLSLKREDIEMYLLAESEGGNGFGIVNIEDFKDKYEVWANSVEESSNNVLIDYDNVVGIWDILPDEYSMIAEKMKNYFDRYYSENLESIIMKFKNENTIDFAGGDGSIENPFKISNAVHLVNINKYMSEHYVLTQDIDISTVAFWDPIGGYYGEKQFDGTLNGAKADGTGNYAIVNFWRKKEITSKDDRGYFGLFGRIGPKGCVQNIDFKELNIDISSSATGKNSHRLFIGVVSGYCEGKIKNITVSGTFSYDRWKRGEVFVGGITGALYGENAIIEKCTNNANIYANRFSTRVGGMAGYSYSGQINYCINNGNLTGTDGWGGSSRVGGMIGLCNKGKRTSMVDNKNNGKLKGGSKSDTIGDTTTKNYQIKK